MDKPAASWDLYRSFLAVVREGSLSGAARALGLTQPTVGRHVDSLEASLGAALFTRERRGLRPTELALELVPHAQNMSAAAAALRRTASGGGDEPRGTIRLSASEVVGTQILPSILAGFRRQFPGVALELVSSDRVSDLLTREADIAVRMARPTQSAVLAKRVGRVTIGLYAHRDYLARCGTPRTGADLEQHAAIGFDADDRLFRGLTVGGQSLEREVFDFRSDNVVAQLAALRAGLGVGGCQRPLAEADPDLVRVLEDQFAFELEVWLAMHEDLRSVRRMRLLFDHLAEGLAAVYS